MQPGDQVSAASNVYRDRAAWLIIAAAAAIMGARLATVESPRGGTPQLSANDRSRWSTVRSLVDEGTYALDNVIFRSAGKRDPNWYSIDLVRHRGPDGRQHYYSSKPTLLTTLVAIPYWFMKTIGGLSIVSKTFYVVRITLLLVHVLPAVLFLILLSRMCDQFAADPWSKLFVVTAASFATPLTTFAITLNNHLPAAVFVLLGTWATLAIWSRSQPNVWLFVVAGIGAAMTAACELPGLSFVALVGAILLWKSPIGTLVGFVPPVVIVGLGMFGTNYWAHGTWSTAYAHRNDGPVVLTLPDVDPALLQPGPIAPELHRRISAVTSIISNISNISKNSTLEVRPLNRGFVLFNPDDERQYALQINSSTLEVRAWNNWYEYTASYWTSGKKQGVDLGESSKLVYAFHALIGHHGVFSLTPIWLLSLWGMAIWLAQPDLKLRGLAAATILLTAVCFVFFIFLRPLEDRNYGGVSCCFRWTVWLIPLWLLHLIPVLDFISRRPLLRKIAIVLLVISVFSATYNSRNPWSHPWLFDYWSHLGWIKY
jgi:hypothetical protein